jgi:putative oxidoreductase
MEIFLIILQVVLGVGFTLFGVTKFGSKQMTEEFKRYGFSSGFRVLTGLLELLGAIGMIAGIWVTDPNLSLYAGALLVIIMMGAVWTHVFKVKDPFMKTVFPIVLMILSAIVVLLSVS